MHLETLSAFQSSILSSQIGTLPPINASLSSLGTTIALSQMLNVKIMKNEGKILANKTGYSVAIPRVL